MGGSAALALPFLPALHAPRAKAQSSKRLLVFFVPEGVNQDTWFPSGGGVSEGLAPLAARRAQFSVIRGMNLDSAREHPPNAHKGGPRTLLNGGSGPSRTYNGVSVPGGQTIDRVVGRTIGAGALYESYELGARSDPWCCSGVGSDNGQISHERSGAPRSAENNPVRTFNDLVGSSTVPNPGSSGPSARLVALRRRRSLLDSLLPEIERTRCALDLDGRAKLEAHLTAVREVELQLGRLIEVEETQPTIPTPQSDLTVDPSWGQSNFYEANDNFEHIVPVQAQIAALALATGVTRSATLTLGHSVSIQRYPWIPNMNHPGQGHHGISHPSTVGIGRSGALADQTRINRWFAEKLNQTLGWLEEYGVLEDTLVLYCSEMANGDHGTNNMPFLIAGMGGSFRLGRDFDAGGRAHNNLFVAILQGLGIDAGRFGGDGYNSSPFTEILV